jgi:hypothetical protein
MILDVIVTWIQIVMGALMLGGIDSGFSFDYKQKL